MSIKRHTPAGHWTVLHVHVSIDRALLLPLFMSPIPDVDDCIKGSI